MSLPADLYSLVSSFLQRIVGSVGTSLAMVILMSLSSYGQDNTADIHINSSAELAARQEAESLNNQGYEQLEAKQYATAEALFRQALELDSTSLLYYENLARSLGEQQKTAQVVTVYDRAQQQFPEVSDLYYYRADAKQKLAQYEAAREDYTQAIALIDQNPGSLLQHLYYFNRGNTYLKQRDYAAALRDYDQAVRINEFHYGSYANRGFARYNLNDKAGACADWRKAQEAGYEAAKTYLAKFCP